MARGRPKGIPKTGGGSRKGIPNKGSGEIKELARTYGPAAIKKLAELAGLVKGVPPATTETAQTMANRDLLDRGYGKPTQGVEIMPTEGLEQLLDRVSGRHSSKA